MYKHSLIYVDDDIEAHIFVFMMQGIEVVEWIPIENIRIGTLGIHIIKNTIESAMEWEYVVIIDPI